MGLIVYLELCRKYGLTCADVRYKEVPDEARVSDNGMVEIWWDRGIEITQKMEQNRPDVRVLDWAPRKWTLVNLSAPWDKNVMAKEDEIIIFFLFKIISMIAKFLMSFLSCNDMYTKCNIRFRLLCIYRCNHAVSVDLIK